MKLKVPDGTEPPVGLAGYRALDGAERTAIRTAYGPDVHVRVQGSGLHKACPSLPYVIDSDVAYLPLHIVESFYVRLMRLAPGVRHDLTVMVDPSALAEVERVALEQGLDASPTTPTVYLQRLQALSMTFLLDDAVVKKILLGKWSEVNWHDDVLVARCEHRLQGERRRLWAAIGEGAAEVPRRQLPPVGRHLGHSVSAARREVADLPERRRAGG